MKLRFTFLLVVLTSLSTGATQAQDAKPAEAKLSPADEEQQVLRQALGEAGNSPVEFLRALEGHLKKYPETTRRDEIERAILKSSIQAEDRKRIIDYGERLLKKERNDAQVLQEVAEALVEQGDKPSAARAATYAEQLVDYLRIAAKETKGSPRDQAKFRRDLNESLSRGHLVWARALEVQGQLPAALEKGEAGYRLDSTAEVAGFLGRTYAKLNRPAEAIARYADAFALDAEDRAPPRREISREMGEVYQKWKGSSVGLGDEVLKAFDRASKVGDERRAALRQIDPNYGVDHPLDFTLSGLTSEKLSLKSLRGKVVVFDFWATWCGPCRAQQPLYEQVKERYKKNSRVVFLNLNTDEERASVKPFLESNKWAKTVWFDDGLSTLLKVNSIPTTMIFNGKGEIVSRMNGFIADRFVDMLAARIEQALAE